MFVEFLFAVSLCILQVNCINYIEKYFVQHVDHFNFVAFGNQTYQQRYIYNDTWWDRGKGPIFFYAGNEGSIESFWNNSGFIFDIAPKLHALVVFAEHRYYGKSLPFGDKSFDKQNIGLLTIEQALADYAFFLKQFKIDFRAGDVPVIAFGGSYGGQLAAYMRFKYPNLIDGAIAASAPIYQIANLLPGGSQRFFQSITKVFNDVSSKCEFQVRHAFSRIETWFQMGTPGLEKISRFFNLCTSMKTADDYNHFLRWIRNSFVMAAMLNYPYPANSMVGFPAFPVKTMCQRLQGSATPVAGLSYANALFYNATEDVKCNDIYQEYIYCADPTGCGLGDDSKAWDYQACTEINLQGDSNGVTDMFPFLPFNNTMRENYCKKTWNVVPRPDQLATVMWGEDILSASNIVFSNGDLDPWAQGGVLNNLTQSLIAVIVKGGAHHLDLRGHNAADPPSVQAARMIETENIRNWIIEKNRYKRTGHLTN